MYEAVPIPEMNEALAVFDGWEIVKIGEDRFRPFNNMSYHSSIEWLWPVWIKIQNTGADCGITFKPYHIAFHVAIDQGDILAAHRTCYDFIKRYNEIQSQTKQ